MKFFLTSIFFLLVSVFSYSQIIYQHNFGTVGITGKPYVVAPITLDANLSNSSWTTNRAGFVDYNGSAGRALSLSATSNGDTYTLTFDVSSGFEFSLSTYSFWRQRSATGPTDWSITVNGTNIGSGTSPTTGSNTGSLTPTTTITGLTGTISIVLTLTGTTGGTFRIDDFTLNGAVSPISANTITTGTVSAPPFAVTCGVGAPGTVDFTSTGTYTGNTYTVQLSNSAGSFAAPVDIGFLVSDANSGTINLTVPASTVTGAGYRIRIVSSFPPTIGSSSAAFTVNLSGGPCNTITTGAVSAPPFAVNCTTATAGTVAFTSTGTYSANTYTAQMSNAAGSFASPTNIGTLVSNANSGTINISIPAATATGAGYLIRVISSNPVTTGSSSAAFTINLSGSPCSYFEIESILVDACQGLGWEGENEMFRFRVGSTPLNTSNITVAWPNNPWRGICQDAGTAATVAAINATITGGGSLIEPTGGVLAAGAEVMFFTNTQFNYTFFDFSLLNYTLYAIFQCADNHPGHFVNYNSTPGTFRTLTMTVTGFGTDAVTYDAHLVYNGDGGAVDFDPPGNPTYGNTGGCKAPLFPLPIELLDFHASCINNQVLIKWTTLTETNNDFFTLETSSDAESFQELDFIKGAGNSNQQIQYQYLDSYRSDRSYYRLKQTDYDGKFSYSGTINVICLNENHPLIYPNPVLDEVNIMVSAESAKTMMIVIYDARGRMIPVPVPLYSNGMFNIDMSGFSDGMYLIQLIENGTSSGYRIIKN